MQKTKVREDKYGKYVRCARRVVRPVPTDRCYFGGDDLGPQDGGSTFAVGQSVKIGACSGSLHFRVKSAADVELWSSHGVYHKAGLRGQRGTVHASSDCWRPKLLRKVDVPPGVRGRFTIETFKVDEAGAERHNVREPQRWINPGVYTRLFAGDFRSFDGQLWMSDTPAEMRDHYQVTCSDVVGNVCLNGLGLGVTLQAVLDNPKVKHVHVLEIKEDVIKLVAPHYQTRYGKRLTVVRADAFNWKPGLRFNFVWHDIWPTICGDHYESMKRLHRRWGKWTDAQSSWCRSEIKRAAMRDLDGRYYNL